MADLVIFDMDGVLVDSEDAMAEMTVRALGQWGITPSVEDFHPFRGMGDRAYVGGVSEKYGVPYEERMKTEAYRLFCENAEALVRVMPWTVPLLAELDRRGYPCSVASAADRIKVESNLRCISRPPEDFASCVTGADVENLKPAPDIFLRAASLAGYAPEVCLVCEDSISGIRAAKAAGMFAVGVTTSFGREELLSAGADVVVDDLIELLSVLGDKK